MKRMLIKALRTLLPERARNALFHLGYNIVRPEFEKFAYLYAYAPNMRLGLEALASRGFSPKSELINDTLEWAQVFPVPACSFPAPPKKFCVNL